MDARTFKYNGKELPDPEPSWSPDDVRKSYASDIPELMNAVVAETEIDGQTVYTFEVRIKIKG